MVLFACGPAGGSSYRLDRLAGGRGAGRDGHVCYPILTASGPETETELLPVCGLTPYRSRTVHQPTCPPRSSTASTSGPRLYVVTPPQGRTPVDLVSSELRRMPAEGSGRFSSVYSWGSGANYQLGTGEGARQASGGEGAEGKRRVTSRTTQRAGCTAHRAWRGPGLRMKRGVTRVVLGV